MRESLGALAYIECIRDGKRLILTQWNPGWQAFNLIGGHKRSSETFRECLTREVTEELRLRESHFRAYEPPLAQLQYTAFSERAQTETAYTLEVYRVDLAGATVESRVSKAPNNRWLSVDEIKQGLTADGRRVSPTIARILSVLENLAFSPLAPE